MSITQFSDGKLQLGGLFDGLKVNLSNYQNVIEGFSNLDLTLPEFYNDFDNTFNWDAIASSIEHCDERALSYFKTLDNGNGIINAQSASITGLANHLEKTGQSYSFAAVKATLLNTAMNASIMFIASFAIQAIVKGLDQYIHRAERAREAAEQAQQAIDASQSNLKKITSTLSATKDRFLELSEGVSRFSKNLSLSEEDYAEYLSISNQLAELFPSLVSDYDEQGNALLLIGENAESTREKLQALLETQQAVAQQTLIDNMDSVAVGIYHDVEAANGTITHQKEELANLNAKRKNLDIDLKSSHNQVTIYDADYEKYGTAMEEALTLAGIKFDVVLPSGETNTFIQIDPSATAQQLELAQKFYDSKMEMENEFTNAQENKLKADIQKQEGIIKTAYSGMNANLQAWMKDNYMYQYLPDGMAGLADALVPEIEWDQLDLQLTSGIDYQNYIDQNILTPLMSVPQESRSKINSMFQTLLSFEEGDLGILPFAETLLAELKALGISIDITPIIANEQDAKAKLTNSIENIAQGSDYYTASGNQVNAKELNELTEYTKEFNAEQIELWSKITLGCNSAEEAITKYEEALQAAESTDLFAPTLSGSISQLATQLAPQFAKLGEAYRSIFTPEGFNKDAIDNSMLEELLKSFTELGEEAGVAFDTSKLEAFFDILTNADSTSSQVQQAFDDLATTYLYSTETLKYLNEETASAIERQLEEMGVTNASELVYDTLNAKLNALTLQKQLLAAETEAVANGTTFSVSEFLKEAGASETAKACLFSLTAAEQIFGNTDLSTAEKVKELKELAAAYGQTAIVARIANMEKAAQDGHIPIDYDKELAALQDEINHAVSNIPLNFNAADGISSAGSAGKAAGDAYMDAFEEELKSLEDLRNSGILSEKQYLDRLRVLYERYFKDKQQYAEQYAKYEHEYLNGYKSLYESVFSHAASLIGDRVSLLQDEKDAALDSLEEQKKAAEESYKAQIRLLEDKRSAIQDEIDKIREANEDRKQAINLQEKERNLAKAENQRTVLQYSEERGFYYEADTEAIQEAREELEDAKADAQVHALEKQQDALDKQIDALQEMADASNEYWEAQKEQTEQYYSALITHMEEYRSRWEQLSGLQEKAEKNALLAELGYSEADLLNEGSGALESLSLSYLGILKDLNAGNHAFINSLAQLTGTDLSSLPGFLEQTRQSLDSLAGINTAALTDNLKGMGESFSDIASSASNAAAAISGNGTAQAEGGQAQAAGGTAGNPAAKTPSAAGGQTSLKAALEDLSTESVDNIHKISDAFAGEDSEGTSVTSAVKKVTDILGSSDPDNAEPDSLMAVIKEQTTQALDQEEGIPAQKQAWEELNEPLGQAAETVTTLKEALEDMDGKAFSVTLNVLGNGDTLAGSISGNYNTPENNGQAPSDSSPGNNNTHGGGGHSRQSISYTDTALSPAKTDYTQQYMPNRLNDSMKSSPKNAIQPIPFPHEDDHSKFAEIFRKFTAAMADPVKKTDFLAAAPKLNPVSQFTGLTSQSNYNNVTNRNINENPIINQEFHITMPNVTNSTSAETLLADLQSIGYKKYQFFNPIKKI